MTSEQLFKVPIIGSRINRNPSCHEILPRLYLGDIVIATNKDEITRLGITHMITVEIVPLQDNQVAPTVKRYLYISVMDHTKQDLMSHFNESNEFIESALKNPSNKVYVHCVAGISRSATIVIAYIMKTRSMTYEEAFNLVSSKRRVIGPNEGFVRQLILYYKMNYTIDIGNLEYRRMVLDALVFEFRLIALSYFKPNTKTTRNLTGPSGAGPPPMGTTQTPFIWQLANRNDVIIVIDQYYGRLSLQQVSKYPQIYPPNSGFKCNKCRAIVFYAISVIENKLDEDMAALSLRQQGSSSSRSAIVNIINVINSNNQQRKDCPFIFIEPQPWMSKKILERDGPIECYKCKRKLGKFDWASGESCSCERHNSLRDVNLFKILKKKVDPPIPGAAH